MSKQEEEFIGIGTYVALLLIFAILALGFWIFDCRRRKRFIASATQNNEMNREQAETLYKIRGNRALLHPANKRFRHLDVFQTQNFQAENFFQLHRWIKCLKEAKRSGNLDAFTDQLIRQMETRMHIFNLSPRDQKRLWELSLLDEEVLSKYDHENALLGA